MLIPIIRKSTSKQIDSLDVQTQAIQAWSLANGVPLYEDPESYAAVESGALKNRESVERALDLVRLGEADGIIVSKLDRLGRSVSEIARIVQELQDAKARLVVVQHNIDTTTPQGKMFIYMAAVFAELERDIIVDRAEEAAAERRRQGRLVSGRVPYGFDKTEDKHLVPNPSEQAIIDRIRKLHNNGKGYSKIALILNEDGVPTKTNSKWHPTQIERILKYNGDTA